ncbi:Transcription elongation factor B polypeptide [Apis cerana cerana]|uniref:Transcription elongation factor B polypeptide n=1 Tax=Apis cerana cerana TaxID=94128 RepID=A0A2A3E4I1_APICC|nr:Transcription elongation factor B polypeptide [Apis cerana cerana]
MSVVDKIKHYQRNIEKCDDNEDRVCIVALILVFYKILATFILFILKIKIISFVIYCISKLSNLPVTVQHLQDTGVGRTVNGLRKYDGGVGNAAKALVAKWKAMVASEETSEGEVEYDDETCVPDTPDSYNINNRESPKSEENSIGHKSEENQKDMYKHKSEKSEMSHTSHNNKYTSKYESKLKINESQPKINNDVAKNSNNDLEKQKKYDKTKHNSHKHESRSDKKSSKDKSAYKKDEIQNNNSLSRVNEENHKKRKNYDSNILKKENKRRKYSDSENDEVKFQPKDKDVLTKNEIKYEKKDSHEKSKSSSSKSRTDSSNSKLKDNNETRRSDHSKESSELKHHNSSSSDKHHDKNSKYMKHGSKESKDLTKIKQELNGDGGIDCHSGASFAEALGMCTITQLSKKRNNNSPNTSSTSKVMKTEQSTTISNKKITPKTEPTSNNLQTPSLLTSNVKLEPLNVDLASTLPEISPNYKPLPYINPVQRKEEDKLLTDVIYVKNQRTKVYSGNKSGYTSVPTLFELCTRVLIENIDALEFTGGVPFDIIKPVLERATADQLFMLEHYNPYLVEDTDELWQYHCNREFRNKQREEMETWRETYMRCLDEREAKLKTLTANIKQSIDKSVPVRSTKLAYVDNVVKPPRNILKKQAKYGTANSTPTTASNLKKKLISGGGPTAATNISVPAPPISRNTKTLKKTKAPLMAKALQLIKGRYKR